MNQNGKVDTTSQGRAPNSYNLKDCMKQPPNQSRSNVKPPPKEVFRFVQNLVNLGEPERTEILPEDVGPGGQYFIDLIGFCEKIHF